MTFKPCHPGIEAASITSVATYHWHPMLYGNVTESSVAISDTLMTISVTALSNFAVNLTGVSPQEELQEHCC